MFSFVKKDWGKQDLELKQSIPASTASPRSITITMSDHEFSNNFLTIYVKTRLLGETHTFTVTETIPVFQLKMMIYRWLGMIPDQQVLMHQEEELDDEDALDDYSIQDGSTIDLVLKCWSNIL